MKTMTPNEIAVLFKKISKFDQLLGSEFSFDEFGKFHYSLKIEDKHLSSPNTCHGGVLAGMMDGVLGVTALGAVADRGCLVSTVEFKINYINPAKLGDVLMGTAEVDFQGKSLLVANAQIKTGEKLIAKGMGTFNIYPMEKNKDFGFEAAENE